MVDTRSLERYEYIQLFRRLQRALPAETYSHWPLLRWPWSHEVCTFLLCAFYTKGKGKDKENGNGVR